MPRALILSLFLILTPFAQAQGDPAGDAVQDASQDNQSSQPNLVADDSVDQQGPPAEPPTLGLLDGLNAKAIGISHQHSTYGSLEPSVGMPMEIQFSRYGTGIDSLTLAQYYTSVAEKDYIKIQEFKTNGQIALAPLALEAIVINGTRVALMGVRGEQQPDATFLERLMWQEIEPGRFRALVVNHADAPIIEIERSFKMAPNSQTLQVSQSVRNMTDQPLSVSLQTYGPVDLDRLSNYSGDRRRVRYGFLQDPSVDPSQTVKADESLLSRGSGTIPGQEGQDDQELPAGPPLLADRIRAREKPHPLLDRVQQSVLRGCNLSAGGFHYQRA